jgi:hypothetical protein
MPRRSNDVGFQRRTGKPDTAFECIEVFLDIELAAGEGSSDDVPKSSKTKVMHMSEPPSHE